MSCKKVLRSRNSFDGRHKPYARKDSLRFCIHNNDNQDKICCKGNDSSLNETNPIENETEDKNTKIVNMHGPMPDVIQTEASCTKETPTRTLSRRYSEILIDHRMVIQEKCKVNVDGGAMNSSFWRPDLVAPLIHHDEPLLNKTSASTSFEESPNLCVKSQTPVTVANMEDDCVMVSESNRACPIGKTFAEADNLRIDSGSIFEIKRPTGLTKFSKTLIRRISDIELIKSRAANKNSIAGKFDRRSSLPSPHEIRLREKIKRKTPSKEALVFLKFIPEYRCDRKHYPELFEAEIQKKTDNENLAVRQTSFQTTCEDAMSDANRIQSSSLVNCTPEGIVSPIRKNGSDPLFPAPVDADRDCLTPLSGHGFLSPSTFRLRTPIASPARKRRIENRSYSLTDLLQRMGIGENELGSFLSRKSKENVGLISSDKQPVEKGMVHPRVNTMTSWNDNGYPKMGMRARSYSTGEYGTSAPSSRTGIVSADQLRLQGFRTKRKQSLDQDDTFSLKVHVSNSMEDDCSPMSEDDGNSETGNNNATKFFFDGKFSKRVIPKNSKHITLLEEDGCPDSSKSRNSSELSSENETSHYVVESSVEVCIADRYEHTSCAIADVSGASADKAWSSAKRTTRTSSIVSLFMASIWVTHCKTRSSKRRRKKATEQCGADLEIDVDDNFTESVEHVEILHRMSSEERKEDTTMVTTCFRPKDNAEMLCANETIGTVSHCIRAIGESSSENLNIIQTSVVQQVETMSTESLQTYEFSSCTSVNQVFGKGDFVQGAKGNDTDTCLPSYSLNAVRRGSGFVSTNCVKSGHNMGNNNNIISKNITTSRSKKIEEKTFLLDDDVFYSQNTSKTSSRVASLETIHHHTHSDILASTAGGYLSLKTDQRFNTSTEKLLGKHLSVNLDGNICSKEKDVTLVGSKGPIHAIQDQLRYIYKCGAQGTSDDQNMLLCENEVKNDEKDYTNSSTDNIVDLIEVELPKRETEALQNESPLGKTYNWEKSPIAERHNRFRLDASEPEDPSQRGKAKSRGIIPGCKALKMVQNPALFFRATVSLDESSVSSAEIDGTLEPGQGLLANLKSRLITHKVLELRTPVHEPESQMAIGEITCPSPDHETSNLQETVSRLNIWRSGRVLPPPSPAPSDNGFPVPNSRASLFPACCCPFSSCTQEQEATPFDE